MDPSTQHSRSSRAKSRLRRGAGVGTAAAVVATLLAASPATAALDPGEDGSWRFDFGTPTSPVAEGYQQVTTSSLYTEEQGWGITLPDGASLFDRDRTGNLAEPDAVAEDFVAGTAWGFQVDGVPDGEYDVTVTIGDALVGTSGTNATLEIEGVAQDRMTTGRGGTTTATFRSVVTDGQLTISITGGGLGAYINGIVVAPALPEAPAALEATKIAWNGVGLSWGAVEGAASYRVLRADGEGDFAQIAETAEASYTDADVAAGSSYTYAVVAVNDFGVESARSESVDSGVIPELAAPATPAGLAVSRVTDGSVVLVWDATANADEYVLERAGADGSFAEIATVAEPGYTDEVDTSAAWSYRVSARNTAGSSEATGAVTSAAYTRPEALPELEAGDSVTFDFGSGAPADGALGVTSATAFDDEWGYGFSTAPSAATADVDRGTGDTVRGDFVAAAGGVFEIDLTAADYQVDIVSGDAENATTTTITAEKMAKVQENPQAAGEYLEMGFPIALIDGRLTLEFGGDAAAINALTVTRLAARQAAAIPTAYIAGDSTVQTYDPIAYAPQAGWGQMIDRFLADDIAVDNHAIGGRSSKNFITQGRLDEILRNIRPGDYLFAQFGHNDATQGVDDRYASPEDYKEYLREYIQGARQRGATPVIVTPVSRRSFNADTGEANVSFPEYVAKAIEVAEQEDALLVDLSASSRAYLTEIGAEAAKAVFLHVDPGVFANRPAGTADDTHFQEYGAIQMARLVAQDVAEFDDPIAAKVTDIEAPAEVPAVPADVVAGAISNGGATLQWTASPTADIYKIYRQDAPDGEWTLVGMVTQPSSLVQGLEEGRTYSYRVVAVNGRGESEPSAAVTFTTKEALYKYDFQLSGNPVMEGYTEITPDTQYSEETGIGFLQALSADAGRDRGDQGGTADNLARDFVLPGDSSTFALDVPNGTYSVKTYSGDFIGSSKTSFRIEGKEAGSGNAGKGGVNETLRGPFLVTDGRIDIEAYGAAAGSRLNGLEITPILLGPTGLEATDVDADPESPAISLAWDDVDGVSWNVYRTSLFDTAPVLIDAVDEPGYTDTDARVGLEYEYYVTAVDQTGLESVPSESVPVSLVDPDVAPPAAATGLEVTDTEKNLVSFSWTPADDAVFHLVFRSEKSGERGELIGIADGDEYADDDVLTTIPYYYTVVGVNAGGAGDDSEQVATEAITTLERQTEYLDRAPVAVHADNGVLVSWRMLGSDPDDIAFHVYRDGEKITDEPVTGSTNLLDEAGSDGSVYTVTQVLDGSEYTATGDFGVQAGDYLSVPLDKPADGYTKDGQPFTYSANDTSVGDIDGDGTYELFVKWDPSNAKDNSQAGYTGNVLLDAYRLDGTRLWRIDLGRNIRAGAHYTQFQVFDYDGNGKAEVIMKTADGTIDGAGTPIGNASADHRNSSGYVLQGPEFLTVFDGATGAAIDTIDYNPPRGDVGAWGDGYGNRVDRFLAGTAYLDGEHPSAIFSRGYYTRAVVAAYDFDGEKLIERWVTDSNDEANEALFGQGNHNLSIADVDGDGKDEIIYGSATLDDDGGLLYSTGLGHGDAIHVSDLIPSRPGLEVFAAQEHVSAEGGMGATMRDAATGEILWSIPAVRDTGRAAAGDVDPRYEGAEGWAIGGDSAWNSEVGQLVSADGEVISEAIPPANFLAWFDGDPLREIVDHTFDQEGYWGYPTISKWNWETGTTDVILADEGARSNNGTKGTPNLQADLFGDWREEIAWRSADSSELRIYSTTDETELRLRTLMHDPVYRLGVAWQNTGYNQPPHTSYFLGEGMEMPAAPSIRYTVDAPEPELIEGSTHSVSAEITHRAIGNGLVLTVTVTNTSDDFVTAQVVTPYGEKKIQRLKAGASRSIAFQTRSDSFDAGSVEITYVGDDGSEGTLVVDYEGVTG
ncbi:hypothetical protein GCM10010922_12230 [Microbacterium sorbitolivorans]|uniref:Fibronectin type-III domain-containing protein n=1 Tax=Microbacterium sorbitolivorans TaxID=1867410 RepID=A0A367XYF0_9MICO|nr:fibronectin type III domain-containing protein [Microbacterium sorbitolivorans]RCK58675.1 hypothetical protein DTO57_11030 [Microbacterium sorbitolivorans]GGF38452.1 hypothetical protein GCM10010922_12230 [Microbacterium sorbitolivorans]